MLHHQKGTMPPPLASRHCTPPLPRWCCTPPSTAGARKPARKAASRAGFTLLEMLVVIVVMALLMGITFRMMRPSEHARAIAATIQTLNLAHAAIAEYHAEYGIYPPVQDSIPWHGLHGGTNVEGEDGNGNKCGFVPGVAVGYFAPAHQSRKFLKNIKPRDPDDQFCFGLVSYLVDRRDPEFKGDKNYGNGGFLETIFNGAGRSELEDFFDEGSHWYERGKGYNSNSSKTAKDLYNDLAPAAKDLAFYKRIRSTTAKIVKSKSKKEFEKADSPNDYFYYTIRDAYGGDGHDLVYICPPPFTSYALFSAGADGKVVTDNPLDPEAQCPTCKGYHNKDNIYANVNVK